MFRCCHSVYLFFNYSESSKSILYVCCMALIRPTTPERGELQGDLGSPMSSTPSWEPDGLGYGKPRALTENSSDLPDTSEANGSVFGRESLRTEPDIDTILPLPGAGQMVNVVSPVGSEEVKCTSTILLSIYM